MTLLVISMPSVTVCVLVSLLLVLRIVRKLVNVVVASIVLIYRTCMRTKWLSSWVLCGCGGCCTVVGLCGLIESVSVSAIVAIRPIYRTSIGASGSMLTLRTMVMKTISVRVAPAGRTKVTVPCRPLQMLWFLLMLVMTDVKRLLVSITLVVPCVVLALCRFTVILTLVRPSVGVLPVLLLATVIVRLRARSVCMRCSPRLGAACVNMRML